MSLRATVFAGLVALCVPSIAIAAAARDPLDVGELEAMRARSPHAAELLEKGEELAAAGSLQEADALFLQGEKEYPNGSLLLRRDCEARTALGQRSEAIQACSRALERARSGPNVRALVSALVDGPTPPSTLQLSRALKMTAKEPDRPTAAAAACDIAEKIGDGVMLQGCAEELVRIAPNDPATRKALSVLNSRCPPWRFWVGWMAIAAAVALTLGSALRRLFRRWHRRSSIAAAAVLSTALCGFAGPRAAAADEHAPKAPSSGWLSKWAVDDQDPGSHIPTEKDRNAEPLQFGYWLQDLEWKGKHASKRGDHGAAAKYYSTLAKAVPDAAIGFTLACQEFEALGNLEQAIGACGQALLADGATVKDYTHFVHLVLAKGRLGPKDTNALANVLAHMREVPAAHDFVDDLECEVAVRTLDISQLRECTAALAARAPNNPKIISYQWALAIEENNFDLAKELVEREKAAGIPVADIASMEKKTAAAQRWHRIRVALAILAVGLFLGGIAFATRAFRRRRMEEGAPPVAKAAVPG